jgi:hypothetical protein
MNKEEVKMDAELRKAYNQSKDIKGYTGKRSDLKCLGTIFESFHDVAVYEDTEGNYWESRYYIGD